MANVDGSRRETHPTHLSWRKLRMSILIRRVKTKLSCSSSVCNSGSRHFETCRGEGLRSPGARPVRGPGNKQCSPKRGGQVPRDQPLAQQRKFRRQAERSLTPIPIRAMHLPTTSLLCPSPSHANTTATGRLPTPRCRSREVVRYILRSTDRRMALVALRKWYRGRLLLTIAQTNGRDRRHRRHGSG